MVSPQLYHSLLFNISLLIRVYRLPISVLSFQRDVFLTDASHSPEAVQHHVSFCRWHTTCNGSFVALFSVSSGMTMAFCGRTISKGSLVAPRMRLVTLPITQRLMPPRPWVARAITSHPSNPAESCMYSPFSATPMSTSATCVLTTTDEVTRRLRFTLSPSRSRCSTVRRYAFAFASARSLATER